MIDDKEKELLVSRAYAMSGIATAAVPFAAYPLLLATCFLRVAERRGHTHFNIQAGSAFFKCARGRSAEAFGLAYEERDTLAAIKRNEPLSMHVWVLDTGDANKPLVVDLSYGYMPDIAEESGVQWLPSLRPKERYFWGAPDDFRRIYTPDEFATQLAYLLMVGLTSNKK